MRSAMMSTLDASIYEVEVRRTIPYYNEIMELAVAAPLSILPSPTRWLDTGCGPGALGVLVRAQTPHTHLFLADPSPAMLELAKARHADLPGDRFLLSPSDSLHFANAFDVITGVQCHHYYESSLGHADALARVYTLLERGGVFFTSENVCADTPNNHKAQRHRWALWQARQGRKPDEIKYKLAREGVAFFPQTISNLRSALELAGFIDIDLVWRAHGQAAFVARKAV